MYFNIYYIYYLFDFLVFYRVDDFILWSMWQVGIRLSSEHYFLKIILRPIVSLQKVASRSHICPFRFQFFYSWNISTQIDTVIKNMKSCKYTTVGPGVHFKTPQWGLK